MLRRGGRLAENPKRIDVSERLSSYTYHDVAGCLVAVLGFALVLVGPGYLLGWATDLLEFRQRPLGERIVWSVPLSFGFTTMVAVMIGKYGSLRLACWVLVGMGVTAGGMVVVELLRGGRLGLRRTGVAVGLLFTLFVVGELVDIGVGNKLYMSVPVYDQSQRAAFVDAAVRTGVPPGNPFYWMVTETGVGHAAPMRYYYFWYVVCGLVVKVAGVSARQTMTASCVWAAFGLVAVIALYCKYFLRPAKSEEATRRRIWISIGLLAVTGLDIIPVIAAYFSGQPTDADMEWWSSDQVTSWMDTILWVRIIWQRWFAACLDSCWYGCRLAGLAAEGAVRCGGWDWFCCFVWVVDVCSRSVWNGNGGWLLWSLGWKDGRRQMFCSGGCRGGGGNVAGAVPA